jgi:hypothetical protein
VVVHIGDEEHAGGTARLRRECLAPGRGRFGRDDALERTFRIAFAGLVVQDEHDLAADVAGVVVVAQRGRRDAEAGEHHRAGRRAAGAEALRIELLAVREVPRRPARTGDLEPVALAQRGGHEVVGLEVRAGGRGGLQAGALEPRADVVAGRDVLHRVGQAAAHRVTREEEEIGTQVVLADRLEAGRALLRAERDHGGEREHGCEGSGSHAGLRLARIVHAGWRRDGGSSGTPREGRGGRRSRWERAGAGSARAGPCC